MQLLTKQTYASFVSYLEEGGLRVSRVVLYKCRLRENLVELRSIGKLCGCSRNMLLFSLFVLFFREIVHFSY